MAKKIESSWHCQSINFRSKLELNFQWTQISKMPRFYPTDDCDFYRERLVDCYHDGKPHVLRKNPLKNPVCWFCDQDHSDPNRSVICSWGIEENFKDTTGLTCNEFQESRIRPCSALPVAGRRGLWKISRVDPCEMSNLQPHTWSIEHWLNRSSFRQSRTSN